MPTPTVKELDISPPKDIPTMTLLTRLSLANRAIVALLSLLIVGIGLGATASMKQELLPAVEQPTAVVVVAKPGASSGTFDEQVVVPLVESLRSVPGVDEVRSNTSSGSAQVTVTWGFGGDGDAILADIESATTSAVAAAPDGTTSNVFAGSSNDIPVLALALEDGAHAARMIQHRADARLVEAPGAEPAAD